MQAYEIKTRLIRGEVCPIRGICQRDKPALSDYSNLSVYRSYLLRNLTTLLDFDSLKL